ncbi:hypothetical protein SABIM44S_04715 [Streptomyces abikoensis]
MRGDVVAGAVVQARGGQRLLALGEEGVVAGPVLGGHGAAQPGEDGAQPGEGAGGRLDERFARLDLALEALGGHGQQEGPAGGAQVEPVAVGAVLGEGAGAQAVGVLAEQGAQDALQEVVLRHVRTGQAHDMISQRCAARKASTAWSIRPWSVPVALMTPR